MAEKKAGKSKGFESVGKFFKDVRFELGKVIWPGRQEIVASTVVVIVAVAFFAAFIGLIDLAFVNLIKLISI
ncbi:MAG TPA: preprotein translocase subunit SecE [Anaerolineae bacterium]|jgi:preprotein translocase subunit SecE|nr:preprotein translocase subunit SecE [Anaerolineae bacterium]